METTLPEMKVTGIMHFAGHPHLTYTLMDTDYFSLRPLVDQIGLDWRTQKKGLLDDDAILFYGTLSLEGQDIVQNPCKYSLKNGVSPSHDSAERQKIATFCTEDAQKDTVFIRLRRVQMYIARISIGHIKAKGNFDSAEYLLALHEEWAEALHDYETIGIAIKRNHLTQRDANEKSLGRLIAAVRAKGKTESQDDRKVLDQVMLMLGKNCGIDVQMDWVDENV